MTPRKFAIGLMIAAAIVAVWDFATPGPISDKSEYWGDYAHFTSAVGTMMVNRMFGGPATPEGFGQFRPKQN